MKSIYKILLLFTCSCGVSCGGDDEPVMTALAVQGIRAEAFPGAIRLTCYGLLYNPRLFLKLNKS